jgi:TonB family protein
MLAALLAARAAALPAQTPGLGGYDVEGLERATHRDLRTVLQRAADRDPDALDAFFNLAAATTDTVLDREPVFAAAAWTLLTIWRDSGFAPRLQALDESVRRRVLHALDRGAGAQYDNAFPATWGMASLHDPELLPTARPRVPATSEPNPVREYHPAELDRLPGIYPGSCDEKTLPDRYIARGVTGRVVLELAIDSAGHVAGDSVSVVSATHEALSRNASRVIRSCRYSPGVLKGRGVRTRLRVPMDYSPDWLNIGHSEPQYIPVQRLQLIGAMAGADFVGATVPALAGDTAALRRLLQIPSRVDLQGLVATPYDMVMATLVRQFGDSVIAATVARLTIGERRALSALWQSKTRTWRSEHPATFRQLPEVPHQPDDSAPDSAVNARLVETAPSLVEGSCTTPAYPEALNQARIDGHVLIEFIIDTTGHVEEQTLNVIHTTHPAFVQPAALAVLTCRFLPGRINGIPVRVRVQQPVNFLAR